MKDSDRIIFGNPHHFTRVADLRLGRETTWTATRDWRQAAKSAHGALKVEERHTKMLMEMSRKLWRVSRMLRSK
jgi:hypothetical protein